MNHIKWKILIAPVVIGWLGACNTTPDIDSDSPTPPTNQTFLLSNLQYGDGYMKYEYNDEGRLVRCFSENASHTDSIDIRYHLTQQRIYTSMVSKQAQQTLIFTDTLFLVNGRVDSIAGRLHGNTIYHIKLRYDDGYLTSIVTDNLTHIGRHIRSSVGYHWQDGNLSDMYEQQEQGSPYCATFTYTSLPNTYAYDFVPSSLHSMTVLRPYGYFGHQSRLLPQTLHESVTTPSGKILASDTYYYYTLDEHQLPNEVVMRLMRDATTQITIKLALTWIPKNTTAGK